MDKLIDDLIKLAFAEDIGDGDHTTLCCIPENAKMCIRDRIIPTQYATPENNFLSCMIGNYFQV